MKFMCAHGIFSQKTRARAYLPQRMLFNVYLERGSQLGNMLLHHKFYNIIQQK